MTGSISSPLPVTLPTNLSLKNLNSIISEVNHIHIVSTVKCHITGTRQLSWTITMATKGKGECQIRMENLHSVVALVCDINSLGLWVDFDYNRQVKLQVTTPLCPHCC